MSNQQIDTLPAFDESRSTSQQLPAQDDHDDLGFVVLWNSDEPATTGAYLPIEAQSRQLHELGRASPRPPGHGCSRLSIVRQTPSGNEPLPPFESPSLSRTQLLVRALPSRQLELVNVGRRRLFVNGVLVDKHLARDSDIIELGGQLTLLCVKRPRRLARAPSTTHHEFGCADAHGLVGESPRAWKLRTDIAFVARRSGHVLVLGDTGSGKELAAKALHSQSARKGALISRNAPTIPDTLVDAELFGNMRGYPNPGMPERKGLVGAAHNGTLFLDEFGDLPATVQSHLLRVLDSGEYQRLGEDFTRRTDFRLIAATNHPVSSLRPDLAARFDFRIRTPALDERPEDIPIIARHLLTCMWQSDTELSRFFDADGWPRFAAGFARMLVQHRFAGNVRELRSLLWSAISQSPGDRLQWPMTAGRVPAPVRATSDTGSIDTREALEQALAQNNGSIEKTWRALGLSNRHALARLLRKHGVSITRQARG